MGLSFDMPRFLRVLPLIAASALGAAAINVPPALASTSQDSIFQDDLQLMSNPAGALQTFRNLGVTRVRVGMYWSRVAPSPTSSRRPTFNATDPAAYPAANWAVYDQIVQDAKADGISVYFILGGPAPVWATGPGAPASAQGLFREAWKPSASLFGQFARAVGTRYSGHYHGLPRVSFWSIWNEPNYGFDIAPQAVGTAETGAAIYRGLVDAAWSGLHQTGHGNDTILIGETAPRGLNRARDLLRRQAAAVPPSAVLRRQQLSAAPWLCRERSWLPDERLGLGSIPLSAPGPVQRERLRRTPLPRLHRPAPERDDGARTGWAEPRSRQ